MARYVIGVIRLAPGQVGYYDELTGIHLTLRRPQAEVYNYMNTVALIRAVRAKIIVLVSGTLMVPTSLSPNKTNQASTFAAPKAKVATMQASVEEVKPKEIVTEEVSKIEVVEETPIVEEVTETVEKVKPAKKSKKKKVEE